MNQIFKLVFPVVLLAVMSCSGESETDHGIDVAGAAEDRHDDHDDHEKGDDHNDLEKGDQHSDAQDEHDEEGVRLSDNQAALANIKVAELRSRIMDHTLYAPGEIKANGYTSYLVSPRVDSVVLWRHVALGNHVKEGQALVTLFSEVVAEAQAMFRNASSEWRRVKELGRKAVGEKRYVAAQAEYDASFGRLLAFGLSEEAIQSLVKNSQPLGEYTLIAASTGAVLSDDFHQGQRVESGDALMELADEKVLWVEARLAPTAQHQLPAGTKAQVKVSGNLYSATVTQEAHTIDPQTRTRVVRLVVNNEAHHLHPGLFADVYFSFATDEPVLAVPESALMRSADGDWTVFVEEEPGQFVAREVDLGRSLGKWQEISGIAEGSRIVMQGSFFVASEIAKSGFDPHDH